MDKAKQLELARINRAPAGPREGKKALCPNIRSQQVAFHKTPPSQKERGEHTPQNFTQKQAE
jgi:hypothetical protein